MTTETETEIVVGAHDLIIFEENLTPVRLAEISEESKTWPVALITDEEYKKGYERHQRFKRTSVSLRKKADEFRKQARSDLKTGLEKIDTDLQVYLDVIDPIIEKLGRSRQRYDDETEAYKIEAARLAAIEHAKEFERQRLLRATVRREEDEAQADYEEQTQRDLDESEAWGIYDADKKERELLAAAAKLEREKYEFECEKTRLSVGDCWLYLDFENAMDNGSVDGISTFAGYKQWVSAKLESRLDFDDAWDMIANETNDWIENRHPASGYIGKDGKYSDNLIVGESFELIKPDGTKESISPDRIKAADEVKSIDVNNGVIIGGAALSPEVDVKNGESMKIDYESSENDPNIKIKNVEIIDAEQTRINDIIDCTETSISYLETEHRDVLENPDLQTELGHLIARVKMNLQIFTDAVNNQKGE